MIRAGCRFGRGAKAGCQLERAARDNRPRNAAFGATRPSPSSVREGRRRLAIFRRAPDAVETGPFATGGPAGPGISCRPATESPVDTDNAPEIACADGLVPSAAPLVPLPRARWRQRAPGRGRAAADAAPSPPRTPIATPQASRPAAPYAAGHRAVDQDGPRGSSQRQAGAVEADDTGDRAGEPLRSTGPGDMANPADTPQATADSPQAGVTGAVGTTVGHRDAAHGGDPGTDIDCTVHNMLGSQAEAHASLDPDDAAVAAEAEPQRAPRDIELWLLARHAQGATLSLDFELRTAMARQVFRRDFVYVSRQLHALEGSRRVQGLDRARLNDALATLRQRADAIGAFMAQRGGELQAVIAARGPAGAHLAFARPARFQATIVSPGAHRFLGLLMQADETLAVLEMAWLLGLVEAATRATLVSDCRRALLGFKDLACDLRHAVGLLVQEINAQRRQDLAAAPED
jgi:hypothetical protein